MHDWRRVLGNEFALAGGFLLSENSQPSREVLCERACCGKKRLAVFMDGNGQCMATCHEEGGENIYLPLAIGETMWYSLDVPRLLHAMTVPWNLRPGGDPGTGIHGAWRIGQIPTSDAALYFLRPPTTRGTADMIARLLATTVDAAFFLAPNSRCIDDACHTLIAPRKSRILPLDEAFDLDDGGNWRALTALCGNGGHAPEPPHAFIRNGATGWTVTFNGEKFTLKNLRGCCGMAILLDYPDQAFEHLQLEALMDGRAKPIDRLGSFQVTDMEAVICTDQEIEELKEHIGHVTDPERKAEMNEELRKLEDRRRADRGIGGRIRKASNGDGGARLRVGGAIREAIKAIRAEHPAAGRHFAERIAPTAHVLKYSAEEGVVWHVER